MGVSLDSASAAEIRQLDQLLSQLADFRTDEEVERVAQEDNKVGVAKEEPTWGASVAEVRILVAAIIISCM